MINFHQYSRFFYEALEEIQDFHHEPETFFDRDEQRRALRRRKEQARRRKLRHLVRAYLLSNGRRGEGLEELRARRTPRWVFTLSGTEFERLRKEVAPKPVLPEGNDYLHEEREEVPPVFRHGSGGNRIFYKPTKSL